jgi:hypothetical protein
MSLFLNDQLYKFMLLLFAKILFNHRLVKSLITAALGSSLSNILAVKLIWFATVLFFKNIKFHEMHRKLTVRAESCFLLRM